MTVANITATYDGELVEINEDVRSSALCTLLSNGDEIVIHEIHDEEYIEELRTFRYPAEWEDKIRFEDSTADIEPDADEENEDTKDDEAETCLNVNCNANAMMVAHCGTGQEMAYCDEHAGGRRAGHARVEEWVEL